LSTGCLRKLGIAAALASGAQLTVIEEPVAALDAPSIQYLTQALDALAEELAARTGPARWVIVSHWGLLHGLNCNEVLSAPSLACAELEQAFEEDEQTSRQPVQQMLL